VSGIMGYDAGNSRQNATAPISALTTAAATVDLGPPPARHPFPALGTDYWAIPSRSWRWRSCAACVRSSRRALSCYSQLIFARPAAKWRAVAFHGESISEVFSMAGLKRLSAQSSASRQR
jgi:hypothetical protein